NANAAIRPLTLPIPGTAITHRSPRQRWGRNGSTQLRLESSGRNQQALPTLDTRKADGILECDPAAADPDLRRWLSAASARVGERCVAPPSRQSGPGAGAAAGDRDR